MRAKVGVKLYISKYSPAAASSSPSRARTSSNILNVNFSNTSCKSICCFAESPAVALEDAKCARSALSAAAYRLSLPLKIAKSKLNYEPKSSMAPATSACDVMAGASGSAAVVVFPAPFPAAPRFLVLALIMSI
jgi:hypothetical protein